MTFLTIDEARAHCRVESDYPAEELQPYMDAAESAASAYLNRAVYADAASLVAAQDGVAAYMRDANAAYSQAMAEASTMADAEQRQAAVSLAETRLAQAKADATRTIHGMVLNASIKAAMLLTLGHLFANREDVRSGPTAAAVQMPMGAQAMLRPFRMVMMP